MKLLAIIFLLVFSICILQAEESIKKDTSDKILLQGIWNADSMEADGSPAPAEAIKFMRFKFEGEKLVIRGNYSDEREMDCRYKIDEGKTPKNMDIFLSEKETDNPESTILGIYELNGDKLKICLRHQDKNSMGRPTEFASKPDSGLLAILFTKEIPK